MEYRVIRHADGKEREKHKYIARVEIGSIRGKKIYRYFYDRPTYQAYLNKSKNKNQKNSIEDKNANSQVNKSTKFLKDGQSALEKLFNRPDEKQNKIKSSKLSEYASKGEQSANKVLAKHGKEPVGSLATIASAVLPIAIKAAKKALQVVGSILATEMIRTLVNNTSKKKQNKSDSEDNTSKKKQNNIDSEDERQDYLERLEYQKNEPDFMKHVKDIPADKKFTKFEDQEQINETYDPYDEKTSTNCANCSAAYELRRRGYDVEAIDNGGEADYNGNVLRAYDYFENATTIGIFSDGSTTTYNEEFMRDFTGSGTTWDEVYKNIDNYNFWAEEQNYTANTLEKGILDNNPPGSRGFIDVVWETGGGHSIVYEVDLSGNVIIRDSQTYDEYSLDEIADRVTQVQITRTDNLELKEDILSAVRTNTKRKRTYYVDQSVAYPYKN